MRPCMYDIMPVGGAIRLLLRLLVGIFLLSQSVLAQHYSFSTVTQDADAEFPSRLTTSWRAVAVAFGSLLAPA